MAHIPFLKKYTKYTKMFIFEDCSFITTLLKWWKGMSRKEKRRVAEQEREREKVLKELREEGQEESCDP